MSNKKASQQLEDKLVKITFGQKAQSWENFDEKKFQRDARRVRETFTERDETILSKGNY